MSRHHRRNRRLKLRSFYVWHRYMGISAAAFMLILAVTGILLNHTSDLELDSRHVQSELILDWYGIEAPDSTLAFLAGDRYVTLMEQRLYLNRRQIPGEYSQLTGAIQFNDLFVVSVDGSILLLTPYGELIERLDVEDGIPDRIANIGIDASGSVVVKTVRDLHQASADFLRWSRYEGDQSAIRWATASSLDRQLKAALQQRFRGSILPIERVLLDLHSGRFFGRFGPWIFDVAGALLILLSLSGTFIWLKRKQ